MLHLFAPALAVLHLVPLTAPNGEAIPVNPEKVVSVRPAPDGIHHHLVRCVVHTDDGKFIAVTEHCWRAYEILRGE